MSTPNAFSRRGRTIVTSFPLLRDAESQPPRKTLCRWKLTRDAW